MNITEIKEIVKQVEFQDYEFIVAESSTGFVYLVGEYDEPCTITGLPARQITRRWPLSPEMTKSEVVSTLFKCAITSMEHRTREWFLYKGRAIYQPHYNVDDLFDICEQRAVRT